jgi:hypothetical protein
VVRLSLPQAPRGKILPVVFDANGTAVDISLLFDLWRGNKAPPFDRLRANGFSAEMVENFPFVLSPSTLLRTGLSKHEQR